MVQSRLVLFMMKKKKKNVKWVQSTSKQSEFKGLACHFVTRRNRKCCCVNTDWSHAECESIENWFVLAVNLECCCPNACICNLQMSLLPEVVVVCVMVSVVAAAAADHEMVTICVLWNCGPCFPFWLPLVSYSVVYSVPGFLLLFQVASPDGRKIERYQSAVGFLHSLDAVYVGALGG